MGIGGLCFCLNMRSPEPHVWLDFQQSGEHIQYNSETFVTSGPAIADALELTLSFYPAPEHACKQCCKRQQAGRRNGRACSRWIDPNAFRYMQVWTRPASVIELTISHQMRKVTRQASIASLCERSRSRVQIVQMICT